MRTLGRRIQLFIWRNPFLVSLGCLGLAFAGYALYNEANRDNIEERASEQKTQITKVEKVVPCLQNQGCREHLEELQRQLQARKTERRVEGHEDQSGQVPATPESVPAPTQQPSGSGHHHGHVGGGEGHGKHKSHPAPKPAPAPAPAPAPPPPPPDEKPGNGPKQENPGQGEAKAKGHADVELELQTPDLPIVGGTCVKVGGSCK